MRDSTIPRQSRNNFRRKGLALLAAAFVSAPATVPALAQDAAPAPDVTLRGRVVDASNGQPIPLARIEVVDLDRRLGANSRGEFELTVPAGSHLVRVQEVGYSRLSEVWTATVDDAGLLVELAPDPVVLEAVRVQANRLESRIERLATQARSYPREALRDFGSGAVSEFLAVNAGLNPRPLRSRRVRPGPVRLGARRGEPHLRDHRRGSQRGGDG